MSDPAHSFALQSELQHIASLVLLLGFVLALAGELLLPAPGTRWNRARLVHGAHNLVLWLIGVVLASFVFGSTVWALLQWMQLRGIGALPLLPLPGWLHAVLAFALLDAADYVFHRLSHNLRWLWLMHAVHHSDAQVDVTTNLRQHPLHIVLTQLWKLAACAAIGVPPWVYLVHEILNLGFAYWHHAAIRWPRWLDRALSWLIVTPRLHWNHHSPLAERTNSNYGVILSCWDRACATLTKPAGDPAEFGLRALIEPGWHSAFGMLVTPWRAGTFERL
jgi:sterol desaturase/sphingolipid hydroxylase (fatty acid hydroxylase superfamily)